MKCLYINLDSRPDRREQAEAEFKRVGLHVERVAAVLGDNRPLAFNQSVLEAMEECRSWIDHVYEDEDGDLIEDDVEHYDDLLLFEDDVVFDGSWNIPLLIQKALEEFDQHVMADPLTIHLGCNFFGADTTQWKMPEPFGMRVAKLHNCWQSHCTWYSAECVEFILNNLRGDVLDADNCIFDEWLRKNVLSKGRSYILRPMVAYQRPGISNIWGDVHTDYTGCHTRGNEWLLKHT